MWFKSAWLFILFPVAKLSLYSGVLALGGGDSMAALCGKLFGKTKWPGTSPAVTCERLHTVCVILEISQSTHTLFVYNQ